LLCKEKFNSDWAACYEFLVSEGFGKLKPFVEKAEIKKALKEKRDLPANISAKGREEFEAESIRIKGKYQFGEFWIEEEEGKYEISRELICRVSSGLGFRSHKEQTVLIDGYLIKEIDDRTFFDTLKAYIDQPDNIELLDVFEEFLQKSGKFTITRLEPLDLSIILRSTKQAAYKFYRNCYICITADDVEILSYDDLHHKIWEKSKKDRDYFLDYNYKGLYYDFINNAIGWSGYLMRCIGFYAHDFRDEEGYMIVTTEKCEDPKDGAGYGKNVFWKLFALTTTFKSTAATMIVKNNQLLQSWNGEKIFVFSDLPRNFDLKFFKDMVTDGAVIRKLYKDEYNIDVADMSKFGASSNYSIDDSDPGVKRRTRIVEFTDFYKKNGGVGIYHGKMFPQDWDEKDYLQYDNVIAACIQEYLLARNVIERIEMSGTGWAKKMEQNYKHLYDLIKQNIDNWVSLGKVSNKLLNDNYTAFRIESNISKALSSFSINKALEDYCEHFDIPFVHTYKKPNGEMSDGVAWKENNCTIKGRLFGEEAKKFLEKRGVSFEEIKEDDLPF